MRTKLKENFTVYRGNYIQIVRTGYLDDQYEFMIDRNGAVANILPYYKDQFGEIKVLLRREVVPSWSRDVGVALIGGGVEKGERPIISAQRELAEEAGLFATEEFLTDELVIKASKADATNYHIYYVNYFKCEPVEATGDGSKNEEESWNDWYSLNDAIEMIESGVIYNSLTIVALFNLKNKVS